MSKDFSIIKNVITSYKITCKCGNSISVVDRIENAQKEGWKLYSHTYPINTSSITNVWCPDCYIEHTENLCKSENMFDRLNGGYYKKYPDKFDADALEHVGLTNHPKAKSILSKAKESDSDLTNILIELESLSELFN